MNLPTPQSHRIRTTDDIYLTAYSYGDNTRPPMVLVHGYPDHHAVWERVISYLLPHFFIISYDVRGAGRSDSPLLAWSYRLAQLSQDLQAVTQQLLGKAPFHLVGHDWGSIQSWESVTDPALAGRILSFSTLSGPCLDHAILYLRGLAQSGQRGKLLNIVRKSWYIGAFHLPLIAPMFWQVYSPQQWQKRLQTLEKTDDIPLDTWVKADGKKGIELYRANFLPRNLRPRQRYAHCPVQAIVLTQDKFVSPDYIEAMPQWVKHFSRVEVPSNHWGILSHPDAIAKHLIDFASRY